MIHLHTHSAASLLDGVNFIEDLVERAAALGMPALALTDHDAMCAAVRFIEAAERAGIQPILGAEVTFLAGSGFGYRVSGVGSGKPEVGNRKSENPVAAGFSLRPEAGSGKPEVGNRSFDKLRMTGKLRMTDKLPRKHVAPGLESAPEERSQALVTPAHRAFSSLTDRARREGLTMTELEALELSFGSPSFELLSASPSLYGRGLGGGCAPEVHHLTLLAKNPTGYANICRLLSRAYLWGEEGYGEGVSGIGYRVSGTDAPASTAMNPRPTLPLRRRGREYNAPGVLGTPAAPGASRSFTHPLTPSRKGMGQEEYPRTPYPVPCPPHPKPDTRFPIPEKDHRHAYALLEWLPEFAEGVICLSGCRKGLIQQRLMLRRYEEAAAIGQWLRDVFSDENFYIEIQRCRLPGDKWLSERQRELAEALGVRCVATNNVHYVEPGGFRTHDILTCIRTKTTVDDVHPDRRLNAENYLKSDAEMRELFSDMPEAIENTHRIAAMCEPALKLGKPMFPHYPLPEGETAERVLTERVETRAKTRYNGTPGAMERLRGELEVINRLGYADYFLAVDDLTKFVTERGIRWSIRGSAPDCAVLYALGVSHIDPIKRNLPFERFLSMERSQKPDIDLDFDADRREEVFAYVRQVYGDEHCAMVCTYHTFRARSALRLVGKALGIPEALVGAFAKKIPSMVNADDLERAFSSFPELVHSGIPFDKWKLMLELCEPLAGLPRLIGTHSSGIIICREPVSNLSPIQMAAKGCPIMHFDKDDVETLGPIKLDVLSLQMLAAIESANGSINARARFDYQAIPQCDPETFKMIRAGDTIGAFQIESSAQQALHVRLNSENQMDIDISVALIRPGPVQGDMVEPFVRRRNGWEPVTYLHPALEPILKPTYGVPVFQRQVIQIAVEIAGFTPGEADQLRKTMSHNRSHKEMERLGLLFIEKAVERGYSRELGEQVFTWIQGFAGYGFCEAHAAAFGDTAYRSAYMLRYYPAEFYAAILSHQPMGFYSPLSLATEARRRGVQVLLPDINESEYECSVEEDRVSGVGSRVSEIVILSLSKDGSRHPELVEGRKSEIESRVPNPDSRIPASVSVPDTRYPKPDTPYPIPYPEHAHEQSNQDRSEADTRDEPGGDRGDFGGPEIGPLLLPGGFCAPNRRRPPYARSHRAAAPHDPAAVGK